MKLIWVNKMKIAIICHDHSFSGANRSLIDWIKYRIQDVEIIIFLPRPYKDIQMELMKYGVKVFIGYYSNPVRYLYKRTSKNRMMDFIKRIYAKLINPISIFRMRRIIKKERVDIVHSNSMATLVGATIAMKANIPHVWHLREFMEEDHRITHLNPSWLKKCCDYSYGICISNVIKEKYEQVFCENKCNVIYNTIEYLESYKKTRRFMEDGICNIVLVGQISANKGQFDAIRAVEYLEHAGYPVKLYIYGTGDDEKALKDYVLQKKISDVEFCGYCKSITEKRKDIDIALMCSYNEALGRVTIEAMYYENLLIGANAGSTTYIVQNYETGLLYSRGDTEDLVKMIKWAIENPIKVDEILLNAKNYALSRFSKSIAPEIVSLYNKILS